MAIPDWLTTAMTDRRHQYTVTQGSEHYPLLAMQIANGFKLIEILRTRVVGICEQYKTVYSLLFTQSKFIYFSTVKLIIKMFINFCVLDFNVQKCCIVERFEVASPIYSLGFSVVAQSDCLKTTFRGYTTANEDEVYSTNKIVLWKNINVR